MALARAGDKQAARVLLRYPGPETGDWEIGPGELCPRCALINEETAAANSESSRIVRYVQEFLNDRQASED